MKKKGKSMLLDDFKSELLSHITPLIINLKQIKNNDDSEIGFKGYIYNPTTSLCVYIETNISDNGYDYGYSKNMNEKSELSVGNYLPFSSDIVSEIIYLLNNENDFELDEMLDMFYSEEDDDDYDNDD